MTNLELIERVDAILEENNNFCDQVIEFKKFNKEYKQSDFYKQTKISLNHFIKEYKIHKLTNLDTLTHLVQEKINSLDLSNIQNLINNYMQSVQEEVIDMKDTWNELRDFKDIVKNNK